MLEANIDDIFNQLIPGHILYIAASRLDDPTGWSLFIGGTDTLEAY